MTYHQLTLDDATKFLIVNTRRMDTETSIQAAQRTYPNAQRHRDLALRVHYEHPDGLTDFELAHITGVTQPSIGKRRLELQRAEFIQATSHTRPSPSGSPARVWRITAQGKRAYEQTRVQIH